jgi:hypothetical protein
MSYGTEAAAVAEMIANAVKASGVIVQVDAEDFLAIVNWNAEPLVVHATTGLFSTKHQYLTSYRGLAFYTKIAEPIPLPPHAQLVEANKIWIPG